MNNYNYIINPKNNKKVKLNTKKGKKILKKYLLNSTKNGGDLTLGLGLGLGLGLPFLTSFIYNFYNKMEKKKKEEENSKLLLLESIPKKENTELEYTTNTSTKKENTKLEILLDGLKQLPELPQNLNQNQTDNLMITKQIEKELQDKKKHSLKPKKIGIELQDKDLLDHDIAWTQDTINNMQAAANKTEPRYVDI